MGENSKIQWTDHTFNPWYGCTNVSPGCDNCYAEAMMDTRMGKVQWGAGKPRVRTTPAYWRQPLKWNKQAAAEGRRYRVFCASLADVFDNEVPIEWLRDLCDLIELTPHLDWLLLTKRIGIVFRRLIEARSHDWLAGRPNVWLGATVVNQEEADRDIPKLLAAPAAVRFLSIEPLLGEIDLVRGGWSFLEPLSPPSGNKLGQKRGVDWIIVGGESGPKARPFDITWASSIVKQCKAAGVPVFVKQLGARPEWNDPEPDLSEPPYWMRINLRDKKGGDMDEWPRDLRVRELPVKRNAKPALSGKR